MDLSRFVESHILSIEAIPTPQPPGELPSDPHTFKLLFNHCHDVFYRFYVMRNVKGTCTNLWNQASLCAQWVLVGFRPWPRLNQLTGLHGFVLLVWESHGAGESERPSEFDRMNENTFTDRIILASSHQTDKCSYMLDYFIYEQTLRD